jgi:hypothetical protein
MATYTPPRTPGSVDPRRSARPGPKDAKDLRTRPISAPRHTRPFTDPVAEPTARPTTRPARPATRPAAKPATRPSVRPATGRIRARRPRAPFILLLVGLLGGAMISLLVISTTLAEGSYQITSLQQQNTSLARQEQLLTQQVAQASSPSQIAQEAEDLGMQPDPNLQFIDLKTGKVVRGKVSQADEEIDVPGYIP